MQRHGGPGGAGGGTGSASGGDTGPEVKGDSEAEEEEAVEDGCVEDGRRGGDGTGDVSASPHLMGSTRVSGRLRVHIRSRSSTGSLPKRCCQEVRNNSGSWQLGQESSGYGLTKTRAGDELPGGGSGPAVELGGGFMENWRIVSQQPRIQLASDPTGGFWLCWCCRRLRL